MNDQTSADQFLQQHRENFGIMLAKKGGYFDNPRCLFYRRGWFYLRVLTSQPGRRFAFTDDRMVTLGEAWTFWNQNEQIRPFPQIETKWMSDRNSAFEFDNGL